jgi:hypothetical protein
LIVDCDIKMAEQGDEPEPALWRRQAVLEIAEPWIATLAWQTIGAGEQSREVK